MRETCTSGSVRGEGGNILTYSALSHRVRPLAGPIVNPTKPIDGGSAWRYLRWVLLRSTHPTHAGTTQVGRCRTYGASSRLHPLHHAGKIQTRNEAQSMLPPASKLPATIANRTQAAVV